MSDTRRHAALVLSGSIGQGHDSVARACAAALAGADEQVDVLDCLALLGERDGGLGRAVFRRLFAVDPLYDAFHFSVLRGGGRTPAVMDALSARRLVPALEREIERRQAPLALAVFATGVGALGRLRARRPALRSAVLCTDAGAHRLWVHPGIDRYLVCSAMAAGTVRQYQPDADVRQIAPPVRAAFFDAPPAPVARAELGLASDAPAVLLLGGAWGSAPLAEVADGLCAEGFSVLAVAGRNTALRERLARVGERRPSLRALGYRSDMERLVAASDVVVTTPGQACHEARVVGRPLVLLDAVPGHGRENVLLELSRGGALASPARPDAVVAAVRAACAGAAGELMAWPVKSADQWAQELRAALDLE